MKRVIRSTFYNETYYVCSGSGQSVIWTRDIKKAMKIVSDEAVEQFVSMFIKPRQIKYFIETIS